MTSEEKSNYMRLQELKHDINRLIREWKTNGQEIRPRSGIIYRALANELETTMKRFEKRESSIRYIEVRE